MTKRSPLSVARLLALLVALALLAGACGGDDEVDTSGGTDTGTGSKQPKLPSATLDASGATFPVAFYEEVIAAFKEEQPSVTVNYGGGGSGKGRTDLQGGIVDFAGSDGLVKAEDVPAYKGGEFLYVPTTAAPITVSYNLPDVKELRLDADTIAKIFMRTIKSWDDPAIKGMNPSATLPATPISVVHRADGSGTTENFTKYLVSAAPATWTLKSGSTVEWPTDTQAGSGNAGVASGVKGTVGAIGYVDLADAKASSLQFAKVKNSSGQYVLPTLEGVSAALDGITINADLSYNPLNAEGEKAYPISAPTWILVYKNQTDKAKGEAVKGFLKFLLTDGQDLAKDANYSALPKSLRDKALAQVDKIVVP